LEKIIAYLTPLLKSLESFGIFVVGIFQESLLKDHMIQKDHFIVSAPFLWLSLRTICCPCVLCGKSWKSLDFGPQAINPHWSSMMNAFWYVVFLHASLCDVLFSLAGSSDVFYFFLKHCRCLRC